jgi:hypothetical protein
MQSTKNYFTIAMNISLLKHRREYTMDHGKTLYCITIMFSKRLLQGDDVLVVVDVGDEHTKGGGANQRRFWQRFPPTNSFRWHPSGSLFLVFDLRLRTGNRLGDYFYRRF